MRALHANEIALGCKRPIREEMTHQACGTTVKLDHRYQVHVARRPRLWGFHWCPKCNRQVSVDEPQSWIWRDNSLVGT